MKKKNIIYIYCCKDEKGRVGRSALSGISERKKIYYRYRYLDFFIFLVCNYLKKKEVSYNLLPNEDSRQIYKFIAQSEYIHTIVIYYSV